MKSSSAALPCNMTGYILAGGTKYVAIVGAVTPYTEYPADEVQRCF